MSQPPYPRQPGYVPNDRYQPPQGPPGPPPGSGWGGPPGGPLMPPQGPPPKKRHVLRAAVLLSIGAFLLCLVVVSAALSSHGNGSPAASSSGTSPAVHSAPTAGQAAAPKSAPAKAIAQPQTLLSQSGSGTNTTARFTVGGSGNWDIQWSYNEGSFGQAVNFAIDADNGGDMNFTGPSQMGTGGSGVTHVYGDTGTHYLSVTSEGDWVIKVVSAP